MNKIERKVQRRIGGRVFNIQVDGANDFISYACTQKFTYRLSIAWSIFTGRPIKLQKVFL